MASVLMVIARSEFRDEEYVHPREVLEAAGHTITVASSESGECRGRFGAIATATLSVADARSTSWDSVVFVGGGGAQRFFDDESAHGLARDTLAAGGVVAAICIAPSILARAGLLDGVEATSFSSRLDDLADHGAVVTSMDVVAADRIITANGPEAARAFGQALADALNANT